jgi:hypothetical protein
VDGYGSQNLLAAGLDAPANEGTGAGLHSSVVESPGVEDETKPQRNDLADERPGLVGAEAGSADAPRREDA